MIMSRFRALAVGALDLKPPYTNRGPCFKPHRHKGKECKRQIKGPSFNPKTLQAGCQHLGRCPIN